MKKRKQPITQPPRSESASMKTKIGSLQNTRNLEGDEISPLPKNYDTKAVQSLLAEMLLKTHRMTPTSHSTSNLQNLPFDPAAGAQNKE